MRRRRKFTGVFKVEAVRLLRQLGRSVGEVAKSLDVGEGLLRKWRDEFAPEEGSAFDGSGKQTGLREENRKLRSENERLRMEREMVRPASTFRLIVSV